MKKIQIIVMLLLTFSASLAQNAEKTSLVVIPDATGIVYEVGKGEIFESAVKIKFAKNLSEGIEAEYKYLEKIYGIKDVDWKQIGKDSYKVKKKQYELIHIYVTAKDTFATIYFDITDFYGK